MSKTDHLTLAAHNPTLADAYAWLRNSRRRLKVHCNGMNPAEHEALCRELDDIEAKLNAS